jgi:hypothetical protein
MGPMGSDASEVMPEPETNDELTNEPLRAPRTETGLSIATVPLAPGAERRYV